MKPIHSIIPIIGDTPGGTPELIGSGVCLQVGSEYFIATATHVFTDNPNANVYIPAVSDYTQVSGIRYGADRNSQDVCVISLSSHVIDALPPEFKPLPVALLEVNDITSDGDQYCFTGYSEEYQYLDYMDEKFKLQRLSYGGKVSINRVYRKAMVSRHSHIIINHSGEIAFDNQGNRCRPFSLNCMSGGGVWKKSSRPKGGSSVSLVGISIEKHKQLGAAVATRINYIVEIIRAYYPHLDSFLPRSITLKLEINNDYMNAGRR